MQNRVQYLYISYIEDISLWIYIPICLHFEKKLPYCVSLSHTQKSCFCSDNNDIKKTSVFYLLWACEVYCIGYYDHFHRILYPKDMWLINIFCLPFSTLHYCLICYRWFDYWFLTVTVGEQHRVYITVCKHVCVKRSRTSAYKPAKNKPSIHQHGRAHARICHLESIHIYLDLA